MVSPIIISAILVWEQNKVQKPNYYVSQTLHDVEIRYIQLEKLIFTLIITV